MIKNVKQEKAHKTILKIMIVIILVAAIIEIVIEQSNLIVFGVEINGVSVGGCTKERALEKLNKKTEEIINEDVVLIVDNKRYPYTKSEMGLELNIEDAVEKAYLVGRDGNIIERFRRRRDYEEIKITENWNYETFSKNIQPLVNLYNSVPVESPVLNYDDIMLPNSKEGRYIDTDYIFQQLQNSEVGDIEIEVRFNKLYGYDNVGS